MRNRYLCLPALMLLASNFTAIAQVVGEKEPFVHVGAKLGGNFQQLSGAAVKSGPGLVVGGFAYKNLIKRLGVRAELLGSFTRYRTNYTAAAYATYAPGMDTINKGDFQAMYVSVPILIEYRIARRLQVVAGPQFSYLASLSDKNGAFTSVYGANSFLKTTDISVVAGIELGVSKRMKFGARYIMGVTDVNNSTYYLATEKWTTTALQVTVSYKIL